MGGGGSKPTFAMESLHPDAEVREGRFCTGSNTEGVLLRSSAPFPTDQVSAFRLTVEAASQSRNWCVGLATEKEIAGWGGAGDDLWYKEEAWVCWDGGAVMNGEKERRRDSAWWGSAGKQVVVRTDPTADGGRVDFWIDGEWQGGLDGAEGLSLHAVLIMTDGEASLELLQPEDCPDAPESLAPCARQWRLVAARPDLAHVLEDGLNVDGRDSATDEVLVHSNGPLLPAGIHAWDVTMHSTSESRNWAVGCATAEQISSWEGPGDGFWFRDNAWIFWDGGALMNGPEERRREAEQWGMEGQTITVRADTVETGRVDFWIDGRWQGGLDGALGKKLYPVLFITDGSMEVGQTDRAQAAMQWVPPSD